MSPLVRRPRMPVSADTAFWLEGASRGELLVQRCGECGQLRHPPRPMCPRCNSLAWDTQRALGQGTVYSFVVYRHQPLAGLPVPYAVLVVELPEGVRMVGNLVHGDVDELFVGQSVQVVFEADPGDDMVLPHWRPLPSSTGSDGTGSVAQ